jgi:D-glycero-D-manno-heptose 1,7-bisphosphate phosphatase
MKPAQSRAAVFLDRDGVLNLPIVRKGLPHPPASVADFKLYPDAKEACALLRQIGPLVVVTNQPDVARGTLDRKVVEQIHHEIRCLLPIERVEVCYEDGRDPDSLFYKPAPGMLLRAAQDLNLDLASSILIGDRWRDIDAGRAAGCVTIWIDRDYAEPLRNSRCA